MKLNDVWYEVNSNYEMAIMTGKNVFLDNAMKYYKEYKSLGGKRLHETLETMLNIEVREELSMQIDIAKDDFEDAKEQLRTIEEEMTFGKIYYNVSIFRHKQAINNYANKLEKLEMALKNYARVQ